MRRLVALVALLLAALAQPADAFLLPGSLSPWRLIASTQAGSTNSTSVTTSAISTTGSDIIVVLAAGFSGLGTLTDSASNTWTAGPTVNANSYFLAVFYDFNPTTSASHTFTLSGGTTFPSLAVLALSGSARSGSYDQTANNITQATGSVTSLTTGSITPTHSSELVLGMMTAASQATGGFSIASPMTLGGVVLSGANTEGVMWGYQFQGTATAINPSFSWTGSAEAIGLTVSFPP